MTPLVRCQASDDDHWRRVYADVITAAGELIAGMADGGPALHDLQRAVSDFHECHVMALVSQLASEYHQFGLTLASVRQDLLARDVDSIDSCPA